MANPRPRLSEISLPVTFYFNKVMITEIRAFKHLKNVSRQYIAIIPFF